MNRVIKKLPSWRTQMKPAYSSRVSIRYVFTTRAPTPHKTPHVFSQVYLTGTVVEITLSYISQIMLQILILVLQLCFAPPSLNRNCDKILTWHFRCCTTDVGFHPYIICIVSMRIVARKIWNVRWHCLFEVPYMMFLSRITRTWLHCSISRARKFNHLNDVPQPTLRYVRKSIAQYFHNNNDKDVIIETYCVVNATDCLSGESRVFQFSRSCSEKKSENTTRRDYDELLLSSKFVLIPPGEGHHSYRLYETLQAGAVPVIVGNAALPFASFSSSVGKEWTRSALRLEQVSRLDELVKFLRNMPQERWKVMSKDGVRLFENYFSSESVICHTAIENLLHERIRKHAFPIDTRKISISIQQPWDHTQ